MVGEGPGDVRGQREAADEVADRLVDEVGDAGEQADRERVVGGQATGVGEAVAHATADEGGGELVVGGVGDLADDHERAPQSRMRCRPRRMTASRMESTVLLMPEAALLLARSAQREGGIGGGEVGDVADVGVVVVEGGQQFQAPQVTGTGRR